MTDAAHDHLNDHLDDHDRGLQHDLKVMAAQMQRRRLLGWLATGGTAALVSACGGGGGSSSSSTSSTATTTSTTTTTTTTTTTGTSSSSCLVDPTETNGPYPSDGSNTINGVVSNVLTQSGVVRSDIRSSFGSSTTTAPGIPVTLTLKVVNANASCAALSGYAVYIWHCTRSGEYSLYSSGIQNENYLRGVQVTNSNGEVTFTTIFPGCYSGRWPHIHFEVYPSLASATSYNNRVLVSQLAMPQATSTAVYATTGYSASVTNLAQITLSSDNVFGDNTSAQIAQQTPTFSGSTSAGYTATATIGLSV